METFSVKLRVWNPAQPQEIAEFDIPVDAHSTFSWISRERLERLGINPCRKMGFHLKRGFVVEEDIAAVYLEIDGRTIGDVVVMAEAGEPELIGAHTLNGLGMVADLVQKRLVPAEMWALSSLGFGLPETGAKNSEVLARS
ncbi:MAG TPA: hypothetical protein VGS78_03535 [Candidatus Sulfotelmatobacter sp.]|nr:hypothetical protein [Candidatus Sulfotelmatobacter sp.]